MAFLVRGMSREHSASRSSASTQRDLYKKRFADEREAKCSRLMPRTKKAIPLKKIKQHDYREPVFKRGAVRTVEGGKRQKHSDVSDLCVGLSFQPTFDDSDDEDTWDEMCEDSGSAKYQWKGDVFRFGDAGMKDEDLVKEIQAP